MVAGFVLLAEYGDVVVSAVDSGSHEVCSARVKTDVLLVDVLLADSLRDEHSIGSQHEAAKLGEQLYVSETCGNEDLVELLVYLLADDRDVVSGLVGAVGYTYAAERLMKLSSTPVFSLISTAVRNRIPASVG